MTTPRIEEMIEEFYQEFTEEVPNIDTPCWNGNGVTPYLVEQWIVKKLTQAHQAGIDEAVERINIAIRSALHEVLPLPDDAKDFMGEFERGTVGGGYMIKEWALEALDDTTKALQDNK